jgi:hypothetical protein
MSIKELQNEKYIGSVIRSKAKILDNNERPSLFFFQLENKKGSQKTISEIEDNNVTYNSSAEILSCLKKFYSNLFTTETIDEELFEEFLTGLPQLTAENNSFLTGPITKAEIWKSLSMMEPNKSPGPDGLTKEFYVTFF